MEDGRDGDEWGEGGNLTHPILHKKQLTLVSPSPFFSQTIIPSPVHQCLVIIPLLPSLFPFSPLPTPLFPPPALTLHCMRLNVGPLPLPPIYSSSLLFPLGLSA